MALDLKETPTPKPEERDGSQEGVPVLRFIAVLLLTLSLLATIVLLLLPLGILQPHGIFFPGRPEASLWFLFMVGLAFGLISFALGARTVHRRALSKGGGANYLILGFAAAVEIFLIKAHALNPTGTKSLWGLFVTLTILGGLGVYLPERAERRERKAEAEKLEAEAANRRSEAAKRRVSLIIVPRRAARR